MLAAAAVPLTTPAAPVNTTLRATDAACDVPTLRAAQRSRHLECGGVCQRPVKPEKLGNRTHAEVDHRNKLQFMGHGMLLS